MKYPKKPELNPGPRDNITSYKPNTCRGCGKETPRHRRKSEREEMGEQHDRIDYWCPHCDTYMGTKVEYMGPVPVQIGAHTWEMQ